MNSSPDKYDKCRIISVDPPKVVMYEKEFIEYTSQHANEGATVFEQLTAQPIYVHGKINIAVKLENSIKAFMTSQLLISDNPLYTNYYIY